ncbi:Synaptic vesicle glycoprotein 2B [Eumeta japonica]|uniref:Synaptic vesicle glycoprotein 2B n=1 Tax=Eumeta variegata TaxID=151549 RepID=A0A4C1U5T5_EUMVA|nr:Synaptic vesicle glycoprotein 2B [Eumeta japonica]
MHYCLLRSRILTRHTGPTSATCGRPWPPWPATPTGSQPARRQVVLRSDIEFVVATRQPLSQRSSDARATSDVPYALPLQLIGESRRAAINQNRSVLNPYRDFEFGKLSCFQTVAHRAFPTPTAAMVTDKDTRHVMSLDKALSVAVSTQTTGPSEPAGQRGGRLGQLWARSSRPTAALAGRPTLAMDKLGTGWYSLGLVCTCSLQLMSIAIDLFGFTLVVTVACDLNLTAQEKGILASIPFLGIIVVSYPWGYLADTRGRKLCLILSLNIGFAFACLCSVAPTWQWLAFFKFMSACFSCAANSVTYTLVGESCAPEKRCRMLLLMNCLLILGPGTAAVISYPTLNNDFVIPLTGLGINFTSWRLLCIVLAMPMGIGGVLMFFFYESPKFLASVGRQEEAITVLKRIYSINHGFKKNWSELKDLKLAAEPTPYDGKQTLLKSIVAQTVPLFRPPLLTRTCQLFYLVAVIYVTNNSFLTWLAHIMNVVKMAVASNARGSICDLISKTQLYSNATAVRGHHASAICHHRIAENTIWTLATTSIIFSVLNFAISHLHARRRVALILILTVSAISGVLVNVMPEPISSTIFYMLFCGTNIAMGILASFFVDFYPTSHRGMVSCLSIMVGRTSSFVGINLVINFLFECCHFIIYTWTILLFSALVTAWYLPYDNCHRSYNKNNNSLQIPPEVKTEFPPQATKT